MFYEKESKLSKLKSWSLEYTNSIKIKFIITTIKTIFIFILFEFQEHFFININECPLLVQATFLSDPISACIYHAEISQLICHAN